jgi:hypothetical protein
VYVLDKQNSRAIVLERFRRTHIITDEYFCIWGQWIGEDPPGVGDSIVLEWIARCNPKPLIIVDSFTSFHAGDENDAAETQQYMAQYRRAAALGATIILLHHTGKAESAQEYRGSSNIKGEIDVGYRLIDRGDGSALSIMELKAWKQRCSVTPHLFVRYCDGEFRADDVEASKTVTERLVDILKANPGITKSGFEDLASDAKLGRNRARDFLDRRSATGDIRVEDQGRRRTKRYHWRGDACL